MTKRRRVKLPALYQRGAHGRWCADLRKYRPWLNVDDPSKTGLHYPLDRDEHVARRKLQDVLDDLERRRLGQSLGLKPKAVTTTTFEGAIPRFMERWIQKRAKSRQRTPKNIRWLQDIVLYRAANFFGWSTPLKDVTTEDVAAWMHKLQSNKPGLTKRQVDAKDSGRQAPLSAHAVNHHLAALSHFFRYMCPGLPNPVAGVPDRPENDNEEQVVWLDHANAAKFLTLSTEVELALRQDIDGATCLAAYVHLMLLTGLRVSEAETLAIGDVDLGARCIHVRSNAHRRYKKNDASVRDVPIWPQLLDVLKAYLDRRPKDPNVLLFQRPGGSGLGAMTTAWTALQKRAAAEDIVARQDEHEVSVLQFLRKGTRHSYCAQRLQSLDGGEPVAPFTVARELGHRDTKMIMRVYSKLGKLRVRTEGVSFIATNARNDTKPATAAGVATMGKAS